MPRVIACQVEGIDSTECEVKVTRRRQLESELVFCLRQFPGILDAKVKLSLPLKTYFEPNPGEPRAAVLLDLDPGHLISKRTLFGLHRLLEESVPDLPHENIAFIDSQGTVISQQLYPHGCQ